MRSMIIYKRWMKNYPIYHTRGRGVWNQNEILMIQVIDPSDLKCVKEEVNIAKAQN